MTGETRAAEPARIGVIGAGWWSTAVHLPALRANARAEIVGICDLDLERARTAAAVYDVGFATDDLSRLLAHDLDGVVIATPHNHHFEPARDAMLSGADVLVEKPMVVDPAEGRELVALAANTGRRLHVGYPLMFGPQVRALTHKVRAGALGEVIFATATYATVVKDLFQGDSRRVRNDTPQALFAPNPSTWADPAGGGGQLLGQVTHCASVLLAVTGLVARQVSALTDNRGAQVDLADSISFATADGVIASIASTGMALPSGSGVQEYHVFGTDGHAVLDTVRGRLLIRDGTGRLHTADPVSVTETYPAAAPVDRLIDSILDGVEVVASGALGLATCELLWAARQSARTGAVVTMGGPES